MMPNHKTSQRFAVRGNVNWLFHLENHNEAMECQISPGKHELETRTWRTTSTALQPHDPGFDDTLSALHLQMA